MEKLPARRHTAAHGQLVSGEGQQHRLGIGLAQPIHGPGHLFPLGVPRGQVGGLLGDGHKFHIDCQLAAPAHQTVQKSGGGDLLQVFRGDRHRRTKDQPPLLEGLHVGNQALIDAGAPSGVGDLPAALNAQHRDQIPVVVQQLQVTLVHKSPVGKDREEDPVHLAGSLDDIPAQHGLAAGQQDEADAQLLRLAEDVQPLLGGQLVHRRGVVGGAGTAGVAACAVEIAAAGDAGN